MKKKRINWLFASFSAVILTVMGALALTACGSGSNDDEPESPADNLPAEAKGFIGCWDLVYSKGYMSDGPIMFFEDGVCYEFNNSYHSASVGYWAYDVATKRLATTNIYQYDITLSNDKAWVGLVLGANSNTLTVNAGKLNDEKATELLATSPVWLYNNQTQSLQHALKDALSSEKLEAYVSKTYLSEYLQNNGYFSLELSPEDLTYKIYFCYHTTNPNGSYGYNHKSVINNGSWQVNNLYNSKKCVAEVSDDYDYFETKSFPLCFNE